MNVSLLLAAYIDIDDEHAIEPFTMKQLKRPVTFVLALFGMATAVLLLELAIAQWKNWRDRELVLICRHSIELLQLFRLPFLLL